MALFKINRGSEKNLPAKITDGYAYFCTNNQNFYIDFVDSDGVPTRKKLGVEYADKLRYLKDGSYIEINPAELVVAAGNNTFSGSNTFSKPVKVATPIADTDAATKKYVDDYAGSGSATIGNVTATATSIDSSSPATATATTSGNDISFAFGIPKGTTGEKGDPGSDYVLTDADKSEIAALVLAQIPDGDEVAYG